MRALKINPFDMTVTAVSIKTVASAIGDCYDTVRLGERIAMHCDDIGLRRADQRFFTFVSDHQEQSQLFGGIAYLTWTGDDGEAETLPQQVTASDLQQIVLWLGGAAAAEAAVSRGTTARPNQTLRAFGSDKVELLWEWTPAACVEPPLPDTAPPAFEPTVVTNPSKGVSRDAEITAENADVMWNKFAAEMERVLGEACNLRSSFVGVSIERPTEGRSISHALAYNATGYDFIAATGAMFDTLCNLMPQWNELAELRIRFNELTGRTSEIMSNPRSDSDSGTVKQEGK